jgi:hypothetical protein
MPADVAADVEAAGYRIEVRQFADRLPYLSPATLNPRIPLHTAPR